jgi:hypothetical protein
MNDAACRPELFMTAIVDVGVGMGRFAGCSSRYVVGGCTGENAENGEGSGYDLESACLSFRGDSGSVFWSFAFGGLIASADPGSAEGMDSAGREFPQRRPPFFSPAGTYEPLSLHRPLEFPMR